MLYDGRVVVDLFLKSPRVLFLHVHADACLILPILSDLSLWLHWNTVNWWLLQLSGVASYNFVMKRKKEGRKIKALPPSKRLRLEAQRVLKERVQDIADKKGIKLRFCSLRDCESHIKSLDRPCENIRTEIGWPPGVPFVHPHDLPNKAKLMFLEAYEPGWTASQQDLELSFTEPW